MSAKRKSRKGGSSAGSIILVAIICIILGAGGAILGPKLVHNCDDCDKFFIGTGYERNIVTGAVSSLVNEDSGTICKECAEKEHVIAIGLGKDVEDFKKPLFGKKSEE